MTTDTRELEKELREEAMRLAGRSLDRGCQDSGIASNLAEKAADAIAGLRAENAELDFLLNEGGTWEQQLQAAEREIADLRATVADVIVAWETDGPGYYTPSAIERWLCDTMKPAIDRARASIGHNPAPSIEEQKAGATAKHGGSNAE